MMRSARAIILIRSAPQQLGDLLRYPIAANSPAPRGACKIYGFHAAGTGAPAHYRAGELRFWGELRFPDPIDSSRRGPCRRSSA